MFKLSPLFKCSLEMCGIRFKRRTFITSNYHWSNDKEIMSSQLQSLPSTKVNYVKDKFSDLVTWYEQLTGMDEVRMMQNRVIEAQDRFVIAQEKRRDVGKELTRIQHKLKEIHSELDTTSRGEERYLQLITEEHAILKDERKLVTEFALLEREERESFNMLSSCVKESHEKERAQAERTKYWSIIGSIVGTIIGVAGSSINNEFKMRELRKLVKESALRNATNLDTKSLAHHEQELAQMVNNMKLIMNGTNEVNDRETKGELFDKLDKVLHSLQNENGIASLSNQVEEVKDMLHAAKRHKGELIAIPQDMETMIAHQRRDINLVIVAVSVMSVIIISLLYRP